MRLIGYARVSTSDQSLSLQIDALREVGCCPVHEEVGSGGRDDRPVLSDVIQQMQAGDTLVVWKLDRLARSLRHLLQTVDYLGKAGCHFKSLTQAIDTRTPEGRLFFHVFGALGEWERDILRERTLAGLQAARLRGRKGGRPKAMNDQTIIVAEALLRDGLLTVREVAEQVGVAPATLYKYLPAPRSGLLMPQLSSPELAART